MADNGHTMRVRLSTAAQVKGLKRAAKREGLPLGTWARLALLEAAGLPAEDSVRTTAASLAASGERGFSWSEPE